MKRCAALVVVLVTVWSLAGCADIKGLLPGSGDKVSKETVSSAVFQPSLSSSTLPSSTPPAAETKANPAIVVAAPVATSPKSFASLQPFQSFEKGDGWGMAVSYQQRTKAQFVALLRNKKLAKQELRVDCSLLVRQMVEAHGDLPFEGCEGAAAAIEHDDNFAMVACKDEMFERDNWLTVTNPKGTAFGVWHRKCMAHEQVLVYKSEVLLSLKCLNVAIPVQHAAPPTPLPKAVAPSGTCPNGWTITAFAYSLKDVSARSPNVLYPRVQRLIDSAKNRDSNGAERLEAYQEDDVSRTLGKPLREAVPTDQSENGQISVRFIDANPNPQPNGSKWLIHEVGVLQMDKGKGTLSFPGDPRGHVAIGTVWSDHFLSPEKSGTKRHLRFTDREYEGACHLYMTGITP